MTLSDTDFLALERSTSGRIVHLYDVFFLLTPEQVEDNKRRAVKGWIADPPPPPLSPQPHDRADKWRRMYGQIPPTN